MLYYFGILIFNLGELVHQLLAAGVNLTPSVSRFPLKNFSLRSRTRHGLDFRAQSGIFSMIGRFNNKHSLPYEVQWTHGYQIKADTVTTITRFKIWFPSEVPIIREDAFSFEITLKRMQSQSTIYLNFQIKFQIVPFCLVFSD